MLAALREKLKVPLFVPIRPAADKEAPKFFEVMADSLSQVTFLRNLTVILAGAGLLLVGAVVRLALRPPMVIRVDNIGVPTVYSDPHRQNQVTGPEVRNFVEHFTRDIHAWDLYTLDEDVDRGLAMMSPDAKVKMVQHLNSLDLKAKVKADSLRSRVVISEIAVERDSSQFVRVKVRGIRVSESYDKKDLHKETMFEDTITARKVDWTLKTPWGLLVENWNESIYKE